MANEKPVVGDHKWPESIDFDQHGNLYFTDAIEKALFQIKRNHNGTLDNKSIPLLLGFDHTSGVSVDRKNAFLYLVRYHHRGNPAILMERWQGCGNSPHPRFDPFQIKH